MHGEAVDQWLDADHVRSLAEGLMVVNPRGSAFPSDKMFGASFEGFAEPAQAAQGASAVALKSLSDAHSRAASAGIIREKEEPAATVTPSVMPSPVTESASAEPAAPEATPPPFASSEVPAPAAEPAVTISPTPVMMPAPTGVPAPVAEPAVTISPTPMMTPTPTGVAAPVAEPAVTILPTPVAQPAPAVKPAPTVTPAPVAGEDVEAEPSLPRVVRRAKPAEILAQTRKKSEPESQREGEEVTQTLSSARPKRRVIASPFRITPTTPPKPKPAAATSPREFFSPLPLSSRLQAFGAWLKEQIPTRAYFICDRHGEIVVDEIRSEKLVKVARTLAHASRSAGRQVGDDGDLGSLHVKIGPDRVMEVIPRQSHFGLVVLGIILQRPLSRDAAASVSRALGTALAEPSAPRQ
ncbi:hypothetical protein N9891_00940 [bacterium]|nr:hypothetical protein [bacterium]